MVRLMSVTVPLSSLADTVVDRLTTTFAEAADPARAARMRAYMKDVAPFRQERAKRPGTEGCAGCPGLRGAGTPGA